MNIMTKNKAKLTAPAPKKKMACSFSMASQGQKNVIFQHWNPLKIAEINFDVHLDQTCDLFCSL
jgi:hypothetical protein